MLFLSFAEFFQNQQKILSGMLLECQKVWIKIRPDQVQAVCKDYQQMTLVGKVLIKLTERAKRYSSTNFNTKAVADPEGVRSN